MVQKSFYIPGEGGATLKNYRTFLFDRSVYRALINTFKLAGGSLLLCIFLAIPMAWGVSRTNMPLKKFIRTMVVLTFATPTFLAAIAWITLLGPGAGTANTILKNVFNLKSSPLNIFSMEGMILVHALFLYPFLFFSVTTALENIDPSFEEAGAILGAGKIKVIFTITLPLIAPAIISGGTLVVLECMALFGAPAILGLPARIYTLSTKIYSYFYFPPRFEMAAAVALPLILIIALILLGQRMYLGRRQYITVGGISSQHQEIDLGKFRYLLAGFCLLVIGVGIFLPGLSLLIVSLKKLFGMPFSLSNFTLNNYYKLLFESLIFKTAVKNSFILSLGASIGALFLAVVLGWVVERTEVKGREIISFLVMICMSFPGIALAVGLVLAFSHRPLALYGTLYLFLIAYIIRGLPITFLYTRSALKQVSKELEEAPRVLGSGWLKSMKDVTVPLISPTLLAAGIIVFVLMFRELSSSIMLYTGGNEIIAVLIYQFSEEGDNGSMAAMAVMVFMFNLILVFFARKLGGESLGKL